MSRAVLVVVALTCAACDSSDPVTVETEAMGMQAFAAHGESGSVEVTVTLTAEVSGVPEVEFVGLEADDALIATLGEATLVLREDSSSGAVKYVGAFQSLDAARLDVALERARASDARQSSVVLPTPFSIAPPPSSVVRGQSLDLEWSASGEVGTSRVLVSGECVRGQEVRIDADPGRATLPTSTFDTPDGVDPALPCQATIQIDRLADGTVDPIFGRGGRIEAAQTRVVTIDVRAP